MCRAHIFYEVGGKFNLRFILQRGSYLILPKLAAIFIINDNWASSSATCNYFKYSLNHHFDRLKDKIKHLTLMSLLPKTKFENMLGPASQIFKRSPQVCIENLTLMLYICSQFQLELYHRRIVNKNEKEPLFINSNLKI